MYCIVLRQPTSIASSILQEYLSCLIDSSFSSFAVSSALLLLLPSWWYMNSRTLCILTLPDLCPNHTSYTFRFQIQTDSPQQSKNSTTSWNTSVVWSILLLFFRLFLFAPILAHHVSGTWKVTGMGSEIRVAAGLEPDCSDLRTLFLISYNSQNQPIKKLKK